MILRIYRNTYIEREVNELPIGRSKEELTKSLMDALTEFAPVIQGKEKPKNNAREKLAQWKELTEEVNHNE